MAELDKPIKNLDQELRGMMSNLINRLAQIQRSKSAQHHQERSEEDDDDLGIITLGGNNVGATMGWGTNDVGPTIDNGEELFAAYVNSNFQAVNNSIMVGGRYKAKDPGVRLDVYDHCESNNTENREIVKEEKEKEKGDDEKYQSSKSEFRSCQDSSSSSSG